MASSVEYYIEDAEGRVLEDFGYTVSVRDKRKALRKFGSSEEVDSTKRTLALLGDGIRNENYLTDNLITQVSAAEATDTGSLRVEGHKIIDEAGNRIFIVQFPTLNGQNIVDLETPVSTVTRLRNAGSAPFTGPIYASEADTVTNGVPDTPIKIHAVIPAGNQTTFKCATGLAQYDFWFLTRMDVSINKKTAAVADAYVEIRELGGVFIEQERISVSTTGSNALSKPFDPYLIVPANADVRGTATATASNTQVSMTLSGFLAGRILRSTD